jgi:hypothetical protein
MLPARQESDMSKTPTQHLNDYLTSAKTVLAAFGLEPHRASFRAKVYLAFTQPQIDAVYAQDTARAALEGMARLTLERIFYSDASKSSLDASFFEEGIASAQRGRRLLRTIDCLLDIVAEAPPEKLDAILRDAVTSHLSVR